MPAKTQEEYCEALDEQGEKRVRELKAQGSFSDRHLKWVDLWLENKERADEAAAQERQEGREEDSLTISRLANKLAKTANTHADDANKLAKRSLYIAFGSMAVAILAFLVALVALFVD